MRTLQKTRISAAKLIGPFQTSSKTVILACVAMTFILALSLIIDASSPSRMYSFHVQHDWRKFAAFLGVFVGGGVCGLLFSGIGQSGLRESASCFWVSIKDSSILVGTAGCLVFALFVWWLSARESSPLDHGLYLIQHDPGGIFAAFMGFVTIVGFAFTLHDLREMRRRITTFPDLMDRLTTMLKKSAGVEVVRILAYTPALGYLALEDREFNSFMATLFIPDPNLGKPHVDMVCLNEKDLEDWHDLFEGRATRRRKFVADEGGKGPEVEMRIENGMVNTQLAKAATAKGKSILEGLLERDKAWMPGGELRSTVKRLPFAFIPGYYFFLSSERAIVVAPLQLPFPKGAPKSTQKSLRGTVQMLGFETNDRAIIRDLADLHETYKHLPSTYVAESTKQVTVGEFDIKCKPDSQFVKEAIDELTRQFEIARGLVGDAGELEPLDDMRRQDYAKLLGDAATLEVTFRVALKDEAPHP